MSTKFNINNMFDSIKTAVDQAKTKQSGGNYKNILSLAAPATYVVRLLPNIKNPKETFGHYFHHGWNSIATGQYVSMYSPSTWGDRCPISELYFKILRNGTEEEQKRAKEILKRKENWLVNVLVIDDPKNPDNNGSVKVLRYGHQLNKVIESAISGDDATEFGAKIFDLSENGCNLRIKAELVSDKPGAKKYPTYTASRFLSPSTIDGLDEAKVYESLHDLTSFVEHKTPIEIQEFIATHYYGADGVAPASAPAAKAPTTKAKVQEDDEDDDVPYTAPVVKQEAKPVVQVASKPAVPAVKENDDKIKNILDGLDDI